MCGVLASDGPFGPTGLTCLLLPAVLAAPFGLLAVAARSLLCADPPPGWLLALAAVAAAGVAYLAATTGGPGPGIWAAWRATAVVALALTPAVLAREVWRRRRASRGSR